MNRFHYFFYDIRSFCIKSSLNCNWLSVTGGWTGGVAEWSNALVLKTSER